MPEPAPNVAQRDVQHLRTRVTKLEAALDRIACFRYDANRMTAGEIARDALGTDPDIGLDPNPPCPWCGGDLVLHGPVCRRCGRDPLEKTRNLG